MILDRIKRYSLLLPREAKISNETEFQWYPDRVSWFIRVYDRVLRRATRIPLPMRKHVTSLSFKGMEYPFHVRLGSSDLQLHQTIRFRGEYRPLQERKLEGVSQVVDLGSNAGFTIRMWREMFPEARIVGVEPDPGNLRICRLNSDAIPGGRVDLVQACVDGNPGSVFLDRSELEHRFKMSEKVSGDQSEGAIEVKAMTVPQVLEEVEADPVISLMKCDVQGAEAAIFADCGSWISRVRNLVVEVHPPYTEEKLISDLKSNGWKWDSHDIRVTDGLPVVFFWGGSGPKN